MPDESVVRDAAVAEAVRSAVADGAGLRIVGAGTWLDAGGPVCAERLLSLRDDRGIVAYVPGDLTVTVRAGTTLQEIDAALAEHGQWLALDPEGGMGVTIGATAATGSWGPSAALFGMPRDQVLGMTVVTGTGDVIRPGGRVVKNVAGFDVTRLMIGAWGTLGVITELTLRVRARELRRGAAEHLRRAVPARSGYRAPVVVPGTEQLVGRVRRAFDPHRVLNPGLFGEPVERAA